ncbi:beta-glucuronidase [Sphingomonas sp. UYAg733]
MTEDRRAPTRREALGMVGAATMAGAAALPFDARAQSMTEPKPLPATGAPSLLYPHESRTRATRDLSGLWRFRLDPKDQGEAAGWANGLSETRSIPVPCSWNDLFDDARHYTGTAWYETEFRLDPAWAGKRLVLRFGSAVYRAKVWLNGRLLGEHIGGHLPFAFDVSGIAQADRPNRLVVLVENKLTIDRVPGVPDPAKYRMHTIHYPQTTYDFFPYSGLHRPVLLAALPATHVHDVIVTTTRSGATGLVEVAFAVSDGWSGPARLTIGGGKAAVTVEAAVRGGRATATIRVPGARLWGPDDPFLYRLSIALGDAEAPLDEYIMKVGIRTVEVRGSELLLNGKPVFLKGFGKHEDFILHGRGLDLAVLVRDFELLKWIGANSFRTSHYPYAEEALMLADEYGFLVISESPAVSLILSDSGEVIETRRKHLTGVLTDLIARDRNHPSVIMWSIANEPLTKPFHTLDDAPADSAAKGTPFFASLFDHVRSLDRSRPVALVSVQGGPSDWVGLGDVICTNSYNGWYAVSGDLPQAEVALAKEIEGLRARHGDKPIFLTEFGADAAAGAHAEPAEMWSEEYQAELIALYLRVADRFPFVIGTHPWAFADFKTSESIMRVSGMNYKGVFTRDRRPKEAAHLLRKAWAGKAIAVPDKSK